MHQSSTYTNLVFTSGAYHSRDGYELSNHLGNVLTTISDKKLPIEDSQNPGEVEYYAADVLNVNDYYPFGMLQPGRSWSAGSGYRYGFNSMERDNEIYGSGNSYDFGARLYDPRLGRWWSVDPLFKKYPSWSDYNFATNNPILYIDPDGEDRKVSLTVIINDQFGIKLENIDHNKVAFRMEQSTRGVGNNFNPTFFDVEQNITLNLRTLSIESETKYIPISLSNGIYQLLSDIDNQKGGWWLTSENVSGNTPTEFTAEEMDHKDVTDLLAVFVRSNNMGKGKLGATIAQLANIAININEESKEVGERANYDTETVTHSRTREKLGKHPNFVNTEYGHPVPTNRDATDTVDGFHIPKKPVE